MDIYGSIATIGVVGFCIAVLACPVCTAIVASSKGRYTAGWFVLGLVFGPFGLLAAIGVTNLSPTPVDIVEYD